MHFKRLIGAAALAFTALAAALPAQAADYKSEYKLSIVVGTNFPWGQGAVIWSDLVRQRTNASTSRSTRALPWSRATRRANSPPSARA